jgi:hypothetical protein
LPIIQVDVDPLPGVMHSVMIQYEEDSFSSNDIQALRAVLPPERARMDDGCL